MTETPQEMLARISRLRAEAAQGRFERQKGRDQSTLGRLQQDIGVTGRFLGQVAASLQWLWARVLAPVARLGARLGLGPLVRGYVWLWTRVTHTADAYGTPVFRRTRGGLMVAATAAFLWFALLPLGGAAVDAAMYAATAQVDERLYLLGSQELDSGNGTHAVEGCRELPCSDHDAIYLRARYSLFNELWSLSHGHGFFYPELVAGSVPYEVSDCRVTTYGVRQRLLVRVNLYPDLLAVTCTPLSQRKG